MICSMPPARFQLSEGTTPVRSSTGMVMDYQESFICHSFLPVIPHVCRGRCDAHGLGRFVAAASSLPPLMSRVAMSATTASGACIGCERLRDELALARHASRASAARVVLASGVRGELESSDGWEAAAAPPLLYQLQKGMPPRARRNEEDDTKLPPVNRQRRAVMTPRTPTPTMSKPKGSRPIASTPPPTHTHDAATQTIVDDLDHHARAQPSCQRCICCEKWSSHSASSASLLASSQSQLGDALDARHRLESEVSQLATKVRSLRVELTDAKRVVPPPPPPRTSDDQRAADQERTIRQLQQRHIDDQELVKRLQMQVRHMQQQLSSSTGQAASSSLSSAGLSAMQMELRSSAEQALLRLQQIFPDQPIGT